MKTSWIQKCCLAVIVFLTSIFISIPAFASETLGDVISDTMITAQVKSAFVLNEITRDQNISVETNNGVVILKGTVDSHTQETAAKQIAQATTGVQSVDASLLNVKPSKQPFKDMLMTAKLKTLLLFHGLLRVHVETENAVIYLSGTVNTAKQREEATQLAQGMGDVAGVKANLVVLQNFNRTQL